MTQCSGPESSTTTATPGSIWAALSYINVARHVLRKSAVLAIDELRNKASLVATFTTTASISHCSEVDLALDRCPCAAGLRRFCLLLQPPPASPGGACIATTPVQYVTAPLGRGAITRVVTATGTVNPMLTVIVGTYVSGVIQNLFCDYNTQVRAGQVCAKIDPRPYQATLDQYSGQLLRDQAVLDKDRAESRSLSAARRCRTRSRVSRPRTKATSSTRTRRR